MASAKVIIPIDKAGRVVLPKGMRDRLGAREGTEFEVIEEPHRIILKPAEREPKLVRKKGVLVFVPEKDYSREEDVVKKQREERDRKFL